MRTIVQDLRYGLRVMRGSPGFTTVAILTLALGLAVNATVFGWIDTILLNPFAGVQNSQELALLETSTASVPAANMSFLDYRDYRDHLKLVGGISVARVTPMSVGPEGRTQRAWGELVSGNYFDLLGVNLQIGRGFSREESGDKPGAHPVVVISDRLWERRFKRDPGVLGKTLRANRQELTIIGVAPAEFRGTTAGLSYDLWAPITMARAMGTGGGTLGYRGTRDIGTTIVRLRPDVPIEQARAEVASLARLIAEHHPDTNQGVSATLVPVWQAHNGAQALLNKPLAILMAACAVLLLIVCANVGNLLLARAVARQKEFGIRLAMGAGRWRLTRQMLTEVLLLASAGAVVGITCSMWMTRCLELLLPANDFPIYFDAALTMRSILFTLAITLVATVVAGTAPALLSARSDVNESLKQGGRGGNSGTHSRRLRSVLVVSEVALATVALVGAGLFFRSFQNASGLNPGFDTSNTLVAQFYLSSAGYSDKEQHKFCRALRERVEALPGVSAVSYSDQIPLNFGLTPFHRLEVEGYQPRREQDMRVHRTLVPHGYFDLLGIRRLEGRDFTENDKADAPRVIIVNETFVKRFFNGANPLGRKVKVENDMTTVVGVVKDSKYHSPMESAIPFVFVPFEQRFAPGLNFNVLVKTAGEPARVIEPMRREALSLNPDAFFTATTLSEATTAALYSQRVAASLLSILGAACLFLASIGLYSVMSYAIVQRTQELGVRMALGASPAQVLGLVLKQGMILTVPGLVAGVSLAIVASRFISGMLIGVAPGDPSTIGAAVLTLGAIATLASYVPAWRATRLNPMDALRIM
jgi:predicted permease